MIHTHAQSIPLSVIIIPLFAAIVVIVGVAVYRVSRK